MRRAWIHSSSKLLFWTGMFSYQVILPNLLPFMLTTVTPQPFRIYKDMQQAFSCDYTWMLSTSGLVRFCWKFNVITNWIHNGYNGYENITKSLYFVLTGIEKKCNYTLQSLSDRMLMCCFFSIIWLVRLSSHLNCCYTGAHRLCSLSCTLLVASNARLNLTLINRN